MKREPNATVTMIVRSTYGQRPVVNTRTIKCRVTAKRITPAYGVSERKFCRVTGRDVSRLDWRIGASYHYELDLSTLKMMEPTE